KGPINIALQTPIDQLQDGNAVKFDAPRSPNSAFIMADGGGDNAPGELAFGGYVVNNQGKINVFAINCYHLSCAVDLSAAGNTFYYCFGGMVFILITFQLLTGVLLALYYVPDAAGNPAPAYTSVQFIQNSVYLGWLIRGVHFWSANLLIIMVLLHMARVYWTGSYRASRELNWIVGVFMLLIVLLFSLSCYLLLCDIILYFSTAVTIRLPGLPP